MKKIFSILVSTVLVVAALSGCSSKTETTTATEAATEATTAAPGETTATAEETTTAAPTASGEKVELTVWESKDGPDQFIQQAGAKFTEQNPNITIKYVNVELGDAAGQIALDGPAGVGPDLFAAPHDKLGELVTGGHILPLTDDTYMSQNALPACVSALTYDGTKYGYPVAAETYALFYNRAFVKDADVPKTWDDVKTFCQKTNNGDNRGFVMDVGNGYYTILFTTSQNNRLFGPTGTDATNTNINSQASVDGMKFFQSLKDILNVPAADIATSVADGAFSSGKAALYITGPWNVKPFTDAKIDFGVTTLPSLPGNTDPAASFSGTRAMFVSAYSNHPAEAAKFGEFLMTPEMQKLRFDITGALPSVNVTVESPYVDGFLKQLNYAFPMPSIPQMGKFWDAMNAASANIWGGADVQKELDACNAAILAQ